VTSSRPSVAPHVLVVEDEEGVRAALTRGLERAGFTVEAVKSARDALAAGAYDVALIDLGLPDQDGVELCKQLHGQWPARPIVVVSGRDGELDVIDALSAGADDYVTKPFSLAVLVARVRRHLERTSGEVVAGTLTVDRRARRAAVAGTALELSPREFDLLAELAERAGTTVSTADLITAVWDAHWSRSTHTVAVHVSALRAKLRAASAAAPAIVTVPGCGYRLDSVPSNR
jgi:DNA-binding response OmpR family regulator